MMDRRRVIGSIGVVALAWSLSARGQPVRRVVRIGIVSVGGPSADMTGPLPRNRNVRAFLRGMAELGYVFGRDFVTEPRGTDAMPVVAELVDLQVDMIVATGGGAALSLLKQATTTIPIIMTAAPDPVGQGFAQRVPRPWRFFWDPTYPQLWPVAQAFGQTQGWKLLAVEIRNSSEIATAFKAAADAGAGALLVPASGLCSAAPAKLPNLPHRLPTMYELRPFVDVGGLVSTALISRISGDAPQSTFTRY
jgi:putative tryptophan/tyrosine transport system substrate-binding protein